MQHPGTNLTYRACGLSISVEIILLKIATAIPVRSRYNYKYGSELIIFKLKEGKDRQDSDTMHSVKRHLTAG